MVLSRFAPQHSRSGARRLVSRRLRRAYHRVDDSCCGRNEALQAHASLRAQARLYRWYLEVQRESLGLFNHRDLDVFYPLPAPLR